MHSLTYSLFYYFVGQLRYNLHILKLYAAWHHMMLEKLYKLYVKITKQISFARITIPYKIEYYVTSYYITLCRKISYWWAQDENMWSDAYFGPEIE